MSRCSAASRREAPPSTRAITRERTSGEYAFGMVRPPKDESIRGDSPICRPLGILRFYSAGTCSRSLEDWSDERLAKQLQATRNFKPFKHEVRRHQQVLAELEAEVARRQAARAPTDE